MGLVVQKFGGSSVGDVQKIKNVARRILDEYKKGNSMVVIVSAMGKTTDDLIKLAKEINPNPPAREMDALMATGEKVSAAMMAMAIAAEGIGAVSLTGQQAGVFTETVHNKARILEIDPERIEKELARSRVVIVAGFQGINEYGDITTIGRGGSDTSAVAIAAALKADYCEIFTDVDGVYTADPFEVKGARKLSEISYEEMLELASLGAGVLHPRAVEVAQFHNVVIHVRSSFNNNQGTFVKEANKMERKKAVTGVAHDKDVAKITIYAMPDKPGTAGKLFSKLGEAKINVDVIVQSSHQQQNTNDITFTVPRGDLDQALKITEALSKEVGAGGVNSDAKVSKVSIVGVGMISTPGVAAKMFATLGSAGVNIDLISTSEIKVSCVVAEKDVDKAVQAVHDAFELEKE
ncbi:MAG: aspartate kinase [Candidatus Margulisiibacteriota bacterium]|jgi:aspartate kinase